MEDQKFILDACLFQMPLEATMNIIKMIDNIDKEESKMLVANVILNTAINLDFEYEDLNAVFNMCLEKYKEIETVVNKER